MSVGPLSLRPHQLSIALMQPQIAANTGNIARLCVVTGTALHLIRPLGFILSDRQLKRSGMDYWDRLQLKVHDDDAAFFATMDSSRCWYFTSRGDRCFWDADFVDGDCLLFGSETRGLLPAMLMKHPARCVRVPQSPGERCLNLSTAAGIGLFEALRRIRT